MQVIVVDIVTTWPMPAIWLMLAGFVVWPIARRLGRAAVFLSCGLIIVSSLPVTGRLLLVPLANVPTIASAERLDAIIVPTAGVFADRRGEWWSTENSLLRLAHGRFLQEQTGLPLYVAGGVLHDGAPSEARNVTLRSGLDVAAVRLEETARNSAETGAAIAALLAADFPNQPSPRVVIVTNPSHALRMSASLRRYGVDVVASSLDGQGARRAINQIGALGLWLPSHTGFELASAAMYEYVGIAWYLAQGRIRWRDLKAR